MAGTCFRLSAAIVKALSSSAHVRIKPLVSESAKRNQSSFLPFLYSVQIQNNGNQSRKSTVQKLAPGDSDIAKEDKPTEPTDPRLEHYTDDVYDERVALHEGDAGLPDAVPEPYVHNPEPCLLAPCSPAALLLTTGPAVLRKMQAADFEITPRQVRGFKTFSGGELNKKPCKDHDTLENSIRPAVQGVQGEDEDDLYKVWVASVTVGTTYDEVREIRQQIAEQCAASAAQDRRMYGRDLNGNAADKTSK